VSCSPAYRYRTVFTDRGEPMLAAEATNRDHTLIEQVTAELKTARSRSSCQAGSP